MAVALLLVDHGSRFAQANEMLHELAALLQTRRPNLIVKAAHMEIASPNISQAVKACVGDGATEIVVHPYMLANGRHATRDVPNMVRALESSYPNVSFKVTQPLGLHDKLADIILERASL